MKENPVLLVAEFREKYPEAANDMLFKRIINAVIADEQEVARYSAANRDRMLLERIMRAIDPLREPQP